MKFLFVSICLVFCLVGPVLASNTVGITKVSDDFKTYYFDRRYYGFIQSIKQEKDYWVIVWYTSADAMKDKNK